jgi:DNA-binding PadR family transcriptional regulator
MVDRFVQISYSNIRIANLEEGIMTQGEVILLRLLNRRSYYGYELDKIIEANQIRRWADIGFSSIYNLLGSLEKKTLVTSRYEKVHGSPRRKVYEITELGRRELKAEVRRMLEQPKEIHDDFTVGIVTSDILDNEEFRHSLEEYRKVLVAKKGFYEQELPESTTAKPRVVLALDRIKKLLEAEIRWIDEI